MASLGESLEQMQTLWGSWSFGKKVGISAGSITAIAVVLSLLLGTERADMTPLMSNLTLEDANEITETLTAMRVPYKLSRSGTTVMVPKDEVHELRMKLAAQGLPKGGGVGFEIFNKPEFGISRFAEKLNYRRGLEGELQRTIRSMDVVKDARVHVVLPKKSLFRDKEESATASVTLHLARGRAMSEGQVQSIVHLVSSSVEGLSSDSVTVVDSKGKILAKSGEGMNFGEGLDAQRKMECDLEGRITQIIERVVGQGKASVQVAAELDYTQSELFQETYDGENPAPRSEQSTEEISGVNGDDAQGIPGARANVVGGPAQAGQFANEGGDRRTAKTTNYELNKTTKREVAQVARLKRMTVAVLVDGVRTPGADGAAETVTARPQEELDQIKALVQGAVGFNIDRGDEVTVVSMNFTPTEEEIELTQEKQMTWQDYLNLLWKPVLGFLFVLVLVGIMFSMRKMGEPGGVPTPILESPQSVRDLEAALTAAGQGAALAGSADAQLAAAAMKSSRPDPEKAAAVIKGWLTEG